MRRKMRGAGLRPRGAHHAHALHSPYWWLKCAVGIPNDDHPLVKPYNKLLVWDIAKKPFITRWTERILNPVLGKSLVVYANKPILGRTHRSAAVGATVDGQVDGQVDVGSPSPARDDDKEAAHAGA